jgi:transcription antitermination factor NusG
MFLMNCEIRGEEDLWSRVHWYAVQSKPNREAFAAANVGRLGVPIFLPRIRRQFQRGVMRTSGAKPLFTGYFFAHFTPSACIEQVRYARGVLRVISSGRVALPLDDSVIDAIEERIGADGLVEIGSPRLKPGSRVRIESGPLAGLIGVLERESSDQNRVTVLLEVLHSARVVIDRDYLAEAETA